MPPRGSPKCWTIEKPVLMDKDNAQETEAEGVWALKRRKRQEAPLVTIKSSKEAPSMKFSEF